MHYQVNRTDQAWENGLKPPFRMLGSFQMHFCNLLMILHGLVTLPKCAGAFSTFTVCNIKSIQLTKLKIMAKNLIFGTLDHSKMLFWDFWMILHDLVVLPNGGKHSSIIICNIKSIQLTKLKIMAKNLIFGSFLHKLC